MEKKITDGLVELAIRRDKLVIVAGIKDVNDALVGMEIAGEKNKETGDIEPMVNLFSHVSKECTPERRDEINKMLEDNAEQVELELQSMIDEVFSVYGKSSAE